MEHLSNGSTSYVKYITGKEELTFTGKWVVMEKVNINYYNIYKAIGVDDKMAR
jgi:hypothetical protein